MGCERLVQQLRGTPHAARDLIVKVVTQTPAKTCLSLLIYYVPDNSVAKNILSNILSAATMDVWHAATNGAGQKEMKHLY